MSDTGEHTKRRSIGSTAESSSVAGSLGLIKTTYNSLFGVFVLLELILSVGLFVLAAISTGTIQTVWLGIGTSLLASTVFSSLQVLVTNRANEQVLLSSVASAAQNVAERMAGKNRRYVPLAEYDETRNFNERFNRDLSADLGTTDRYIFNGLTGRYIGPRLRQVNKRINEILVVVGDPRSDDAVRIRIEHRRADSNSERQRIKAGLQDDIDLCIIGLFRSRNLHGPIELTLASAPILDRVELCDQAGYLTLFSARVNPKSVFPQTLRCSPDSPFYVSARREARRIADASGTVRFRITEQTDDADLVAFYHEQLHRDLGPDGLRPLFSAFEKFEEGFIKDVSDI
jgi:hypothetical protein